MLIALLQSDPSLLPCRIESLRSDVEVGDGQPPDAIGVGYAQNSHALLRKQPGSVAPDDDPFDLLGGVEATGVVAHVRHATVGGFRSENIHPFRFQNWLFGHDGTVARFGDLRPRLLDRLPPFLQRTVAGDTDSEHLFVLFLSLLKDAGILEAHTPSLRPLADAMAQVAEVVEQLAEPVGGSGESRLNLAATNGRVLVACRFGDRPLYWTLRGAVDTCPAHDLDPSAPASHPHKERHLGSRTLVVATKLRAGTEGWTAFEPGQVLAVDREFEPLIQ